MESIKEEFKKLVSKKDKFSILKLVKKNYNKVVKYVELNEDGDVTYYCSIDNIDFDITIYFDEISIRIWDEDDFYDF